MTREELRMVWEKVRGIADALSRQKQDALTPGEGIAIEDSEISATHELMTNWDIEQLWNKTEG